MESSAAALAAFVRALISCRDTAISESLRYLNAAAAATDVDDCGVVPRRWSPAAADSVRASVANGVIPDVVDMALFTLVRAIDNGELELFVRDANGEFKSIEDIGNWEMPGFYIGDGGWRAASTTTVNSFTS